ncbi:uncharacterized protein LOC127283172 [Leptopilina boulardi]|uniref:uncharacterized protein LOC127283172 n=1 Tax=Leptopilina boulardi TaxID=63433 RepID=UPI0021F55440|nr:uncharacterized protein LOC127283172 [Leptopilina boulardi]XP_051163830.1 uncharacterized protein LOC127283172 [Leptopilina boulardi]
MTFERGALLVLEGCDRAGKSTQVKMLLQALHDRQIPAEIMSFPDRTTTIGAKINKYLLKEIDLEPGEIHSLFSQNRWEKANDMIKTLQSGKTLIVDRYAASGAAYASAYTGKDLDWCKNPDKGLPRPDLVAYLKVSEENQMSRSNWGDERFEKREIQLNVADNFQKLKENNWNIIDANQNIENVHKQILDNVLEIVQRVKNTQIKKLYQNDD